MQELLKSLIDAVPVGDWSSLTINVTQGPKEGPQLNINYQPRTTEANAKGVQVLGLDIAKKVNAGQMNL